MTRAIAILLLAAPCYAATLSIATPATGRTTGSITLSASCSAIGAQTYAWSQISGPSIGAFGSPTSSTTTYTTPAATTGAVADYVVQLVGTGTCAATVTVHVGAASVNALDIVSTGLTAIQDWMTGPILRRGSSPWTYFDITSPALATAIGTAALANPPTLGAAIAGTAAFTNQPMLLTGTGTNWVPDLTVGTYYIMAWTTVDGAGTGRLEFDVKILTDDTHAQGPYDQQATVGSGNVIYQNPGATATFNKSWWGMDGGAGNNSWNYYGAGQAQYREHFATGLTAFLTNARAMADYWWQWAIDHGRAGHFPRVVDLQSQFMRALDGKSNRFPDLYTMARYYNITNDMNRPDSTAPDIREAGYAQGMLAMGARADTDATRHAGYCALLVTKTALWISSQNVTGYWNENLYLSSGLGSAGGYVTNVSVSPWRQIIAVIGLQQTYDALSDTSATTGCNQTSLAASLKTTITRAMDFTYNYGRAPGNGGVYYTVQSPQDEQTLYGTRAGTVSCALSSTACVGTSTLFTTQYSCNNTDYIGFDQTKTVYKVLSCADATHLTLGAAIGTLGESGSISASTIQRATPSSTSCGNSASNCIAPGFTPPNGDTNLTRALPGAFGWACSHISSTYCDQGDRWFGVAFGGPADGSGGVAACAGPYCANLQTDWRGAVHACAVDPTLPCNNTENYAQGNAFAYLNKNFGEGNGTPNAQRHLADRLTPFSLPPSRSVISGRVVVSSNVVR